MSFVPATNGPVDERTVVDRPRLWAGGVATSVVAALAGFVGVLLTRDVLGVRLHAPPVLLGPPSLLAASWAFTAACAGMASTGILLALLMSTPRPRTFFTWIIVLLTATAVALPFAQDAPASSRFASALINIVIGIAIGTLLTGVASRTTNVFLAPPPAPDKDGAY
jgi:Family of unknown function (DUF6069)